MSLGGELCHLDIVPPTTSGLPEDIPPPSSKPDWRSPNPVSTAEPGASPAHDVPVQRGQQKLGVQHEVAPLDVAPCLVSQCFASPRLPASLQLARLGGQLSFPLSGCQPRGSAELVPVRPPPFASQARQPLLLRPRPLSVGVCARIGPLQVLQGVGASEGAASSVIHPSHGHLEAPLVEEKGAWGMPLFCCTLHGVVTLAAGSGGRQLMRKSGLLAGLVLEKLLTSRTWQASRGLISEGPKGGDRCLTFLQISLVAPVDLLGGMVGQGGLPWHQHVDEHPPLLLIVLGPRCCFAFEQESCVTWKPAEYLVGSLDTSYAGEVLASSPALRDSWPERLCRPSQDEERGFSDGEWQGVRYFHCPPKRGLFVKLESCQPDQRFQCSRRTSEEHPELSKFPPPLGLPYSCCLSRELVP